MATYASHMHLETLAENPKNQFVGPGSVFTKSGVKWPLRAIFQAQTSPNICIACPSKFHSGVLWGLLDTKEPFCECLGCTTVFAHIRHKQAQVQNFQLLQKCIFALLSKFFDLSVNFAKYLPGYKFAFRGSV